MTNPHTDENGWQDMSSAPRDRKILLDLSYYYDHDKTPTEVYLVGEWVDSENGYVWDTGDEVFRKGAPRAWLDIPKTNISREASGFPPVVVTKRIRINIPVSQPKAEGESE
jgi:hypothetical protein